MAGFLSYIGKFWLFLSGWKLVGNPLPANKYVLIVAYHTSNWDFLVCIAARFAVKAPISWIGKHTLFSGSFGAVMRRLGGVPVNRELKTDMVSQVVAQFRAKERFSLALFPEGTRQRVSRWRTGFYQIAMQAGVPIQTAALDYTTKSMVFGSLYSPTGNYQVDMEFLKQFFRIAHPAYPELADMDFETSEKNTTRT